YETNCCGISLPSTISLVVEETPNITASSDQQFCLGTFGGVQLSVSGAPANASIQWTPTTGLSNFNTPTVNALPSTTTTYTVTVANASGLCASTDDVLVSVTDLNIQVNTTSATCAVLGSVTASVSGGSNDYSYSWSNGGTSNSINGLQAGNYTVIVTDNVLGCMDSIVATVSAGPATLTAAAVVSDETCPGANDGSIIVNGNDGTSPYTFSWTELGVVNTGTALSDTMMNLLPGTYEIVVTDVNGCVYTLNETIIAADPFNFVLDSFLNTTCLGLSDGFARIRIDGGLSPYTLAWTNGLALVLDNGDVLVENAAPGDYTLVISDTRVCTDSFELSFTVDSVPTFILDTLICEGTSFNVFGNDLIVSADTSVQDTSYAASGCVSEINIVNITAIALPLVDLIADPDTILNLESSTLIADDGYLYDWGLGTISTDSFLVVTPSTSTSYTLVVYDDFGCNSSYEVTVYLQDRELELMVPDAFSPNGDGVNDIFRVVNPDYFEDIEMKIYNRWGELIHKGKGYFHGWDGNYKNREQEVSSYAYVIKATSTFSGERVTLSGNVTLIR
ncbi:MAG: gliding motility-associated C-terminal domain-containing protein, partial [Bacteroidetes bacterium]|nr:gliding motility-associated C-terminal domain-containing protein [Bacteroidota bacterium]